VGARTVIVACLHGTHEAVRYVFLALSLSRSLALSLSRSRRGPAAGQVDYARAENRVLFHTLFRYMQSVSRCPALPCPAPPVLVLVEDACSTPVSNGSQRLSTALNGSQR